MSCELRGRTTLARAQWVVEWLLIGALVIAGGAVVVTGLAGVVYLVIVAWKAMLG